jgi:superfamily II DNA or RNA helicase
MNWKDFLGNEYLSFEEAREFARNLNLKSAKEWYKWFKRGVRPENIPTNPDRTYKDKGWKSWADFLGTIGNGNKWTKSALLGFLGDFKEALHTCSMAQLFTIIEATGLSPYFTIDMLYEMQETASNSPERIEVVSNIINEIVYGESDESTTGLTEEASLVEAQLSDGTSISSILDNIYESQLTQLNQIKYLTSLENESITAGMDEEKIQFLITESVNTLWYSLLNDKLDVEEIKSLPLKGKVPTTIVQTFYKEYKSVMNLKLPKGWTYPHKPLLMQKLIAYRLSERKRYGNWSSVGSGKTISAILAGRYVGAKNTLVITFNSTIGKEDERGWVKEIRDSFKDSNIYTKTDKNIKFSDDGYNYLVLNYEVFQQATSADFVLDLLKRNRFDYIILDEVQSIKNRGGSISKRRDLIMGLINKVKENNPDYYLLAMSATPVINNLEEVKSLFQIIQMDDMDDIDTYENVGNCLQMYRRMTNYGIRYKNVNDNILKGNQYTILDVEADELYPYATSVKNEDFLSQDQLTLRSKLDAVLPYINTSLGKTIIYTHLVKGIDKAICEYLTERGFKVGVYTGNESELNRESALSEYINGDIDILVASRPIATGVDGLQKISDRLIILSLPWTFAELIQLVGRINRTGSLFWETGVDVIIPLVSINGLGHSFRWDYRKYNLITYKETIANAAVDGIIPKKIVKSKEELISYAEDSISEWIERIKESESVELKTS